MLFNSYEFIFYFAPVVIGGYFLLGRLCRDSVLSNIWLVVASVFFYGYWKTQYAPLLIFSIAVNYFISGAILRAKRSGATGKGYLILGLAFDAGLLGYFKYTDFLLLNLNRLGAHFDLFNIALPLGVSFFTITQSAYLIDCYKGDVMSRSFSRYALFVTFFPHLLAGPILYHRDMMRQFADSKLRRVNWDNLASGLFLFVVGLAKKVLIADKFVLFVQSGFANAGELSFRAAWAVALAYTFQLYFDFSGYSDMASGLARMLNIEIPINFNAPYRAASIIEFWRRWHMSLGTWVKNYLYIPMGGANGGERRKLRNLFLSMLIVGLWHGAGWTFVFWGGTHGIMLAVNHWWRRRGFRMPRVFAWLLTFGCVTIAWVFFRAPNFKVAWQIVSGMFGFHGWGGMGLGALAAPPHYIFLLALGLILLCPPSHELVKRAKFSYSLALVLAALFGYMIMGLSSVTEFLYFQF